MAYKFLNEIGLTHIFTIVKDALKGKSDTNHTHLYAGSSSVGGVATSAEKLTKNAGSATQPIYFSNGVPVNTKYELNATVPSSAKFTDTVYTLPNATSSVLGGVKVGTNISVNDGTISVANASTSAKGVVQLSNAVNSTSTSLAATAGALKTTYDLANGKQSPATTLVGYGITDAYTKTEVDTALSGKLSTSGTAAKATADASGNNIVNTYAKKSTTLNGYGITNAYTKTEVDTLINALQAKITELESKIPQGTLATVATTGSYKDLVDLPTKLNEIKDY